MTFVIGTKANDEWEGNEDGGVSVTEHISLHGTKDLPIQSWQN